MNRELFLSILSLDAYNRGYDAGLGVNGFTESGRLGGATIREFSSGEQAGWVGASFYAIAYDATGAGVDGLTGRVISYRGTDDPNPSRAGSDFWQGWTIGAGFAVGQAKYTIDFYNAVLNTPAEPGDPATTHSIFDRDAAQLGREDWGVRRQGRRRSRLNTNAIRR